MEHCKHYNRNCRILAPCCNKIFSCRLCHDEFYEGKPNEHKINRHGIQKVICKPCNFKQEVSNKCKQCSITFGNYFCSICKFYDNDTSKKQFHCEKCGICRVGGRENFYHCDKCNSCISISLKDNHNCIENSFHTECPICLEDLFTSTTPATILKCGHSIHQSCYLDLIKSNNIKCPLCNKSIIDMTGFNSIIENEIVNTPMPNEYNYDVEILCNDCNKTSTTKFHIIGFKCQHCNSFNTVQK